MFYAYDQISLKIYNIHIPLLFDQKRNILLSYVLWYIYKTNKSLSVVLSNTVYKTRHFGNGYILSIG